MRRAYWIALAVAALGWIGCDGAGDENAGRGSAAESANRPAHCPAPGERLVQGRVLVPVQPGRSDAGAMPTRRERPSPGSRVEIYHRERPGELLGETETDAKGRWCVALPDRTAFDVGLIARASWRSVSLRRSLVAAHGQNVSTRSEVLHRVLRERLDEPQRLSRAAYLNMEARASTAVDLLDPVRRRAGEGREAYLERMQRRLLQDARFVEHLETIETGLSE